MPPNVGVAKARADGRHSRFLSKGMQPDISPGGRGMAFARLAFGLLLRGLGDGRPRGSDRLLADASSPDWRPLGLHSASAR